MHRKCALVLARDKKNCDSDDWPNCARLQQRVANSVRGRYAKSHAVAGKRIESSSEANEQQLSKVICQTVAPIVGLTLKIWRYILR